MCLLLGRLSGVWSVVTDLFVVLLAQLTASLDALQDVLAVLIELELLDDDLAGVDAEGHALAGRLVAGDALDVDLVLEAVDRQDLALAALVGAPDDLDLVVLADGDAADLGDEEVPCEQAGLRG